MRRVRRTLEEPRLEIMPLVDVIFLLLTFFVFAITLMVRAQVLDVSLPRIGAGRPAEQGRLITIAIDRAGALFLDGEPIEEAHLGAATAEAVAMSAAESQQARVVIAADESGATGRLLHVLDALAAAGVENVSVMGRPADSAAAPE